MITEGLYCRGAGISKKSVVHGQKPASGRRPACRSTRARGLDEGLAALAESIILQCLEDLWSPKERQASMDFFGGEGFRICAEAACMNSPQQFMLLGMIERAGFRIAARRGCGHA